MQSLMNIWSFVPDSVKRTMGVGTVNTTTKNQTPKTNQTKTNTGVPDWVNTYMKNSPGMQPYVSGVSYGAVPSSNKTNQNLQTSFQQVNNPTQNITVPSYLQQTWNTATNAVKPTTTSTAVQPATSGGTTPTPKVPTPTVTPKAPTTKVVVTLPNGSKMDGFINPKDNKTYFDSAFTKPVTTAGAKVTVIKGDQRTDYTVKGAPISTAGTAGATGTGGQATGGATGTGGEQPAAGAGTGAGAGEQPKKETTTTAIISLPNGKQVEGYVKGGITYYMENGVETRVPTGALVKVGDKTFQRTETGGQLLEGNDLLTAQSNFEATQRSNAMMENITNFQTRLTAQRDQGILQAERGAEMARGGLQNQMFQDWLGARQAMTNRGLTGSGIAEDANTRLQMAGQQRLAELYTNLSTQINAIDSNYQLSNQEKEQEKLNLQNSFFQLRDEILQGKQTAALAEQKTKAEIASAAEQSRLAWAKEFGYDPQTGEPTQKAKEFQSEMELKLKQYGLNLADVTGYIPSVDANGKTTYIPTLSREKFMQSQKDTIEDRNIKISQFNQRLQLDGQQLAADQFTKKVGNIEGGLNNLLKYHKDVYDDAYKTYAAIEDKESQEATDAYATMQTAYSQWISTGAQYAEFNQDPLNYVDKVSNNKVSGTGMTTNKKQNQKSIGDFLIDFSRPDVADQYIKLYGGG